jgi:hypothetical protein
MQFYANSPPFQHFHQQSIQSDRRCCVSRLPEIAPLLLLPVLLEEPQRIPILFTVPCFMRRNSYLCVPSLWKEEV